MSPEHYPTSFVDRPHLCGSPQRGPEHPHRNEPHSPRSQEAQKHRAVAAALGIFVERRVLAILANHASITIDTEELRKRTERLQRELSLKLKWKALPSQRITDLCDQYSGYDERALPEEVAPINTDLREIMEMLDESVGTNLLQQFRAACTAFERYRRRCLLATTLIIAEQIYRPSIVANEQRVIIPDVRANGVFQFDGITAPRATLPPSPQIEDFLGSNAKSSYEIIQVKTFFDASYASGRNTLKKIPHWIRREQKDHLARAALYWQETYSEPMSFPERVWVLGLRGFLPPVVLNINLDYLFYQQWLEELGKAFRTTAHDSHIKEILNLVPSLERAKELAAAKETRWEPKPPPKSDEDQRYQEARLFG